MFYITKSQSAGQAKQNKGNWSITSWTSWEGKIQL